ncbi:MAG: hypothetical protein Ta2G_14910 [Termitinemataceae bacterium]|nr:MAG: hypothetical protein Ta2G_14910 [Termitinemataceae bacterium]
MKTKKTYKNVGNLFYLAVAVLFVGMALSACKGSSVGDIITEGGGPTARPTEKGVFVTFAAPEADVNAERSQKGTLVKETVPKVTYLDGSSEDAFLEAVRATGGTYTGATDYDYLADPLSLGEGKAELSPLFRVEKDDEGEVINIYRYVLGNTIVAVPLSSTRDFKKWQVAAGLSSKITSLSAGSAVDAATFHFYTDEVLAAHTGAYATINAVYEFKPEYKEKKDHLHGTIEDIHDLAEHADYDDEKLIGKGGGDSVALQALIDRATALMLGESKTLTTAVDGEFYFDADGDYTDEDGHKLQEDNPGDPNSTYSFEGTTYLKEQLPLPVLQTISYIDWDFGAIDQMNVELEAALANPDNNWAHFVPNALELPFKTIKKGDGTNEGPDKSNYYSVTVVETGWYEIDLYGASGGHVYTASAKTALGGKGGHTKAVVKLTAGDVLKVFVGGEGKGSGERQGNEIVRVAGNNKYMGGFPNGGDGAQGHDGYGHATETGSGAPSGAGGGSTEVQLFGTYDEGVNNRDNLVGTANDVYGLNGRDDRLLLVAGGGGGASQCGGIAYGGFDAGWPGLRGGNAGPISTADSTDSPAVKVENSIRQGWIINNGEHQNKTWISGEVTYTKVYTVEGVNASGEKKLLYVGLTDQPVGGSISTGIGGSGGWPNAGKYEPSGGGGGGYRGGASSATSTGIGMIASGSGGTNYIKGGATVRNITANSTNPNYGNGRATIKWVSEN